MSDLEAPDEATPLNSSFQLRREERKGPKRSSTTWSSVPLYRQLTSAGVDFEDELDALKGVQFLPSPKADAAAQQRPARTLLNQVPPVLLATLLNLMLSVPFGSAFFPIASPEACAPPPPLVGVRLFLVSTVFAQTVLGTSLGGSGFDQSQGMMMVENTPFMHSIATAVTSTVVNEMGAEDMSSSSCPASVFPTLLFSLTLTTALSCAAFFLLGHFKLGAIVYFFPKHVLCGCISGIGVFVTTTGLEVSKGMGKLEWSFGGVQSFFLSEGAYLYLLVLLLVLVLRVFLRVFERFGLSFPLFPPLYFLSVTPLFYLGLYVLGVTVSSAKEMGFFFPASSGGDDPSSAGFFDGGVDPNSISAIFFPSYSFASGSHNPFALINWAAVANTLPVQVGCVIFSLMHVPINIPSMSMSVNVDVDMNSEMIAHGRSNLFSALFFQLPNYMCYSNSVAYAKSGGYGQPSSIAVILLTTALLVKGSSIVEAIPRAMAGTLLVHVGLDLFFEGITSQGFDRLEVFGIWAIIGESRRGGRYCKPVKTLVTETGPDPLRSSQCP